MVDAAVTCTDAVRLFDDVTDFSGAVNCSRQQPPAECLHSLLKNIASDVTEYKEQFRCGRTQRMTRPVLRHTSGETRHAVTGSEKLEVTASSSSRICLSIGVQSRPTSARVSTKSSAATLRGALQPWRRVPTT